MTEPFDSKYNILLEKSISFQERLKSIAEKNLPNEVTEELFAQLESLQNACEELCIQNEELVASNELVLDQQSTHKRLFIRDFLSILPFLLLLLIGQLKSVMPILPLANFSQLKSDS